MLLAAGLANAQFGQFGGGNNNNNGQGQNNNNNGQGGQNNNNNNNGQGDQNNNNNGQDGQNNNDNNGGNNLCLDPANVQDASAVDGLDGDAEDGQAASATSVNQFEEILEPPH